MALPGADEITFVNRFTVHAAGAESARAFERAFDQAADFMAAREGFLGHALLRPTGAAAAPQYVNVARWRDEAALRAAIRDPGFADHAAALRALATSEPTVYRSVQVRGADAGGAP